MSLALKMTVHRSGGKAADGSVVDSQSYADEVWLQRDLLRHLTAEGKEVFIDFSRRRVIEFDKSAHTYMDTSLYADVAARHFESKNRQHIRSVIQAAGADMPGMGTLLTEHQLGVRNDEGVTTITDPPAPRQKGAAAWLRSLFAQPTQRPRPHIEVELRDGFLTYSTAPGRLLLAYSTEGFDAEETARRDFVRLLRILYNGHPLILERLTTADRIPRELRYAGLDPMGAIADELTIRIQSVEAAPDRPIPMAGQRRVPDAQGEDPVAAALARALAADPPDQAQVRERRLVEVEECLAAGRSVEAALALCELGLEIAIPPEALGPTMRRAADAHVGTLMNAICQAETARGEAARPLLAAFASFRQAAGRRAHVLNTFESLCHVVLGEPDQAIERLLAALAANPLLVGAYKDLGDLFMRDYQMRRAWTCWEAARRFSPQHAMLTQITDLEKTLATEHPEFF